MKRSSLTTARLPRRSSAKAGALGLLLVLYSASLLRAQVGGDNPTGPSGIFNGQAGGCGYDPYTANATRSITDISVAGAVGEYPLALVRTANSRTPSTTEVFGWAGGWNHNYNWILEDSPLGPVQPTRYTVEFPDGRVEKFRVVNWDSYYRVRPGSDAVQGTSAGVRERFVPVDLNPNHTQTYMRAYLILPDGGKVEFWAHQHVSGSQYWYHYHVTAMIDPYGLRTTIDSELVNQNTLRRITRVTEPAGRYLQFTYTGPRSPRIASVTEYIGGVARRSVNYSYLQARLTYVFYHNNPDWTAHYQYCSSNIGDPNTTPMLLRTCDDPMYAGPMKRIAYDYKPATPNNPDGHAPVYGQILRERYYDGTNFGIAVSTLTVGLPNNNPVYRTETRGDGATRTFIYNGAGPGYLAWASDFTNRYASQTYDQTTKYIISVMDRRGNTTDYTSDRITGNVTQIKYPLTQGDTPGQNQRPTVNHTYTNNYYLHTIQGENSFTTTITRDGNNRGTQIAYPDGGYETFTYNGFGQVWTHRLKTGGTESFAYDANAQYRLQYYSDPYHSNPGNPSIQYFYEAHGWVNGIFDASHNPTNWTYNDRAQVLVTTLPTDPVDNTRHTITSAYNPDGTLQSRTNELGFITSYEYDDYRRLTKVTPPARGDGTGTHPTSYVYYDWIGRDYYTDTNAQPSWVVLPSGKLLRTIYDANWRKSSVTIGYASGDDATTSDVYDEAGNLQQITNLRGQNIITSYDERNRPSSINDRGRVTTFNYDSAGRTKKITRPNGQTITYDTFDAMNRVTQQTATQSPNPYAVTKYAYYTTADGANSPVGLLKTMQDPHLAGTNYYKYEYDFMGRKKKLTYPPDSLNVQRTEQWTYDTTGRPQTFVNRNGDTQTFTYDALNRLSYFTWNDGLTPRVDFGYDAASRLTTINNMNANITRAYYNDNLLWVETEAIIGGTSNVMGYGYDEDGNRSSTVYPDGATFDYTYTGRNQLSFIRDYSTGAQICHYVYDENGYMGDLTTRTLANSTSTTYQYDLLDRVTHITHSLNVRNTRTFDYAYDSVDNRKWTKRDGGTGDVFRYDQADQVNAVKLNIANPDTTPTPTPSIVCDANGNRTTFSPYGPTDTYTTNYLNQYTQRNAVNAQYDPKGNLISGFDGSIYTFDAQNRLLTAQGVSFKYDGLNRQVSRTANGVTTYSVWDGWDLVQEYHMSGNSAVEDASYLYGPTGLVKELRNNRYYYQDGSGSTSHLASSSGSLQEWYRYDLQGTPFVNGDPNNHTSAYGVRHLFTGQQWYSDIGLYDLRNRFYSPDIGRFLQPDPIGFEGDPMNLYRYAGNNPITNSDPSGEKAVYKANGGYWYYIVNPGYPTGISIGPHGWCAEGAQILAGGYLTNGGAYHDVPNTSYWRQGAPVTSATTPGIVVARGWVNGKYAGALMSPAAYTETYRGLPLYHTGILIASFNGEAFILEQYVDKNGVRQPLTINGYPLKQLQQEGWSEVTVPESNGPYAVGTSTDPNARGGSDAPTLSEDEQARVNGLLGLANRFNPYWGYLPTTATTNFAGGRAGPLGVVVNSGPISGSIFGPTNFYSGLDPIAAFGSGASSAGANHANGVP
jgi:RHS repeat-associated protein